MRFLLLSLLLVSSLPAQTENVQVEAGRGSYGSFSYTSGGLNEALPPVRFSVTLPADEIVFAVTLQVIEPDEGKAHTSLEALAESVRKSLGTKGKLTATAPANLSPTLTGKVKSLGSSIFSSGDTYGTTATLAVGTYRLAAPIAAGQNPQALGFEIKALLSSVKLTEPSRLQARGWMLNVSNPEAHRPALLKQLHEALEAENSVVGGKTPLNLTGLDKPLVLTVSSDREVRVSLPVAYSYGSQR